MSLSVKIDHEAMDPAERVQFEIWMAGLYREVEASGSGGHTLSSYMSPIYWLDYFIAGVTPAEALAEDQLISDE